MAKRKEKPPQETTEDGEVLNSVEIARQMLSENADLHLITQITRIQERDLLIMKANLK